MGKEGPKKSVAAHQIIRGKQNVSMEWVDVKKAHDSVDHKWFCDNMAVHRFPTGSVE